MPAGTINEIQHTAPQMAPDTAPAKCRPLPLTNGRRQRQPLHVCRAADARRPGGAGHMRGTQLALRDD